MSRRLTFALIGVSDLGLAHVIEESRPIDWSTAMEESGEPAWREVLPHVTLATIAEHAEDMLTEAQKKRAETIPHARPSAEALADAFMESDAFDDWRQGFEPMMSYMYPVRLRLEQDARELASLLEEFAPSCTLCEFEDNDSAFSPGTGSSDGPAYAFALNGGGMDLSDQIAAAYLCAGHVPPYWVLSKLPGVMSDTKADVLSKLLPGAYKKAADWFKWRAKDMLATRGRMYPPKPKA